MKEFHRELQLNLSRSLVILGRTQVTQGPQRSSPSMTPSSSPDHSTGLPIFAPRISENPCWSWKAPRAPAQLTLSHFHDDLHGARLAHTAFSVLQALEGPIGRGCKERGKKASGLWKARRATVQCQGTLLHPRRTRGKVNGGPESLPPPTHTPPRAAMTPSGEGCPT